MDNDLFQTTPCPLCNPTKPPQLPLPRILDKLDALLATRDTEAAKRHLAYWIDEAKSIRDLRSEASLENERMGLFRKCGEKENAMQSAHRALALIQACDMQDSLFAGTVALNAATVYKAFGHAQDALPLYGQAQSLYTRYLPKDDLRFAGLYNNMALAEAEMHRFDLCIKHNREALSIGLSHAKENPGALADAAITCLNMADALYQQQCKTQEDLQEEIDRYLDAAEEYLFDPSLPKDAYFAFVAEKCAPAFGYHGRFLTEKKLKEESERIYAAH